MNSQTIQDQDRQAILHHIDSVFRAFISNDRETLLKTHTSDFRGFTVRSRQTIHSREQYMAEIDALLQHQQWKFYEISDLDMGFYGDTCLVAYIAKISGKDTQERFFETSLRIMDVYIKQNGEWNEAASSASLHPDVIDRQLNAAIQALTLA